MQLCHYVGMLGGNIVKFCPIGDHVEQSPRLLVRSYEFPVANTNGPVPFVLPAHGPASNGRAAFDDRKQIDAFLGDDLVVLESAGVSRAGQIEDGRHEVDDIADLIVLALPQMRVKPYGGPSGEDRPP
jgi:hypothetical protein